MREPEYLRLRKQIQAEYQHKLQALDTVWAIANQGTTVKRGESIVPSRRGALQRAVREAVDAAAGELSVQTVEAWLRLTHPDLAKGLSRSSISQALKRLTAAGVLVLVQEGKGKRPATYRKA